MLIEGVGKVTDSIHVTPVEVIRQMCRVQVRVGKRMVVVVVDGVVADLQQGDERDQKIFE